MLRTTRSAMATRPTTATAGVVSKARLLAPLASRRLVVRALVAATLIQTTWLAYPSVRARILAVEETAAARGDQLATRLGCFACHGAGGGGGIHNPGSEEGEVPAFGERTQMMYVKNAQDLREYI